MSPLVHVSRTFCGTFLENLEAEDETAGEQGCRNAD